MRVAQVCKCHLLKLRLQAECMCTVTPPLSTTEPQGTEWNVLRSSRALNPQSEVRIEIAVERRAPHREIGVRIRVRAVRARGRGEVARARERNDSAVARAGQEPRTAPPPRWADERNDSAVARAGQEPLTRLPHGGPAVARVSRRGVPSVSRRCPVGVPSVSCRCPVVRSIVRSIVRKIARSIV